MKNNQLHLIRAAGATLFMVLASVADVMALERWLVPDTSQCAADTTVNPCHTTLSDAVTSASAGDSIRILPGTYPANVTLTKNITIFSNETAKTFLTGNGGNAITVDGVTTLMDIKNITFINASPGILIKNASTQVNIRNNVFQVGNATTAVQVTDTSTPVVMNNVFYSNGTAVLSTPNTLSIINNIFSGNSLAISSNVAIDNILNNLFFQNTAIGPTTIEFDSASVDYKGNLNNEDPLFVSLDSDIVKRDFHLMFDALNTNPCRNAGNAAAGSDSIDVSQADIGAYGGSNSDTVPFAISDLYVTGSGADSISLRWSPNKCYLIGGYNVYYGTLSSTYAGTALDVATIPAGNYETYTIPGLAPASAPTGTLVLSHTFASNTFNLVWDDSDVSGATGYEIRYDASLTPSVPPAPPNSSTVVLDAGNVTTYQLGGLVNGTYYYVQVTPYAQATYYIAVKVFYAANSSFLSDYSNEVSRVIGSKAYDATSSNVIYDFPEAITPSPNLPNKGCFIATAAYGHYSAPQVQALRDFRDEYLLTNAAGSAFVRWYYEHGPVAAQFISEHPWLKPVVRTALLPAVGGAMFMTRTAGLEKAVVLSILTGGIGYLLYRRKYLRSGGRQ